MQKKSAGLGLSLLFLSLAAVNVHAAVFKDTQLQAALDQDKDAELQALARARLKSNASDAQGLAALALLAQDGSDEKLLDTQVKAMQQCVEQQPREAVCHYALGSLMGTQAMMGGMMKAMTLTGRIKSSFAQALALDPASFEYRSALQQFYLMAPGIAGGSSSKAAALAQELRDSQPEQARLLRARVAMKDDQLAEVERELAGLHPGADIALAKAWQAQWIGLGLRYLTDKNTVKAQAWFERFVKDQPGQAMGPYGLGRVAAAQNQWEEALRQYEQARGLPGAEDLPVEYRIGLALIGKGDKAQARAALQRYLGGKPRNKSLAEDAQKRLAELG